jgi:hypothetical protein
MVRLNRNFAGIALLGAVLTFGAQHASAQATTPQAPQSPPSPSTPAASGGPIHWTVQGNQLQPAAPAQPQGTVSSTPQAVPPATPYRAQGTVPGTAPGVAPGPHPAVTPDRPMPTMPTQASGSLHRKSASAKKTVVAEVPPTPAPPPPTLDHLPPTPPQVRFQNGQLTIDAQNSTLAQVLRAVQAKTGASIDIPGGAGGDRVATLIGPGQPRDVLNTLLNGSRFDYVILGVAGDPGAVQKVILTPRQAGSTATTATAQNNPTPQPQPEDGDEGSVAESEPEYQNQNPEQPPRPPGGFRHPGLPIQPPLQQDGATPEQQQQPPDNGAKTPEQLMQELQQMQQQQQQLQEQLNPANRQPPQ